jgi:urease accessory protein
MNALLLLLLDSRSPAGGHNHSGGMEPAIMSGLVRDLDDVEAFCRGRLRTQGRVSAAFAAAACALWLSRASTDGWRELDAELDARTPSEAVRAASHQLGRGLLRLVRATAPGFVPPWGIDVPNHALVLGAGVALAGGDPLLAARAAALTTVTVPASAGVRLLGLDPFATHAMSARLAPEIDRLAADHAVPGPARELPAHSAPALDLLADFHLTAEVRLFAS